jgi:putative ABC transport system permease protein
MEGIDPNWDEIRVEGKNYEGGDPPLRLFNSVSPGTSKPLGQDWLRAAILRGPTYMD